MTAQRAVSPKFKARFVIGLSSASRKRAQKSVAPRIVDHGNTHNVRFPFFKVMRLETPSSMTV